MLIFFVIIYFILTLLVGFYASRQVHNAGDFINAGRNLHPAINTAALFALWFGSETLFGASAEFAERGLLGVIEDPLGGVLCLLIVGFFYSRKLYRLNIYTIGDVFRNQYGPRLELVSTVLMILSFIGYAGAQIVALGLICQTLLGIDLEISMFISVAIVLVYTFTGGMWAVSITDFIQSVLIVIGLVSMVWYVTIHVGGIDPILKSLTPAQKQFFPENNSVSWLNWIGAWMVLGFGSVASQDIFQRINSARSEKAAYWSTICGALLYLVFSMLPLYLVCAIKLINPNLISGDLQLALPQMVLNYMPQWLQILFFGSVMSAIMSTCSGALLAPGSLLAENILKPVLKKNISDSQFLLLTRLSVMVIGLTAFALALSKQNIFHLVSESSAFGLVSIFVPFSAALLFNHSNRNGAIMSMFCGTSVWAIFTFFISTELSPLIPGLAASLFGFAAGNFFPLKKATYT